ncbi:MAG: 2-oxoglutarate and iron-dependent oxygenase domain-containing protein [Nocardioides sp.]|uniref:isopenicillin N synthase family dioxygenase n=1 Tax=Nocardioides sp. TaxID=35761 RepID=UPI0039E5ADD1
MTQATYALDELNKEARMGQLGVEKVADGDAIPKISLRDFDARRAEITDQLWAAATEVGFFQLVDHGLPQEQIDEAFAWSARFFDLPREVKEKTPLRKADNVGWEFSSQVRPSVGVPDQKESYQITKPRMDGLWPAEEDLPGFRAFMDGFETRCWEVAMQVLSCFADRLGFERDFFAAAHDPSSPEYQSTLRLVHYFPLTEEQVAAPGLWRAGAHTDFDCLTLLFQREGQHGLQVCPGRDLDAPEWTPVPPGDDAITCNIGDMLMRWSDDQLLSNFHRVRSPLPGEYTGARYSIPFFAQANRDVVIRTPQGKYEPITAHDYLWQRITANYGTRREPTA